MSNNLGALLSATFYERGYEHLVEVIHQRDAASRRRLDALDVAVWDEDGARLTSPPVDPGREILDVEALVAAVPAAPVRVMVTFDARYDPAIFPYRPHHYAYLHRRGSTAPALYYAVNAVLGGVPDRIGAARLNNFETYVFRASPFAERYSVLLGNVARFSPAEPEVTLYYERDRETRTVTLGPKTHVEL